MSGLRQVGRYTCPGCGRLGGEQVRLGMYVRTCRLRDLKTAGGAGVRAIVRAQWCFLPFSIMSF